MSIHFKKHLLKITGSTECEEVENIQSLWSGYGRISRFQLSNSALKTVVVKFINLSTVNDHPRGWNSDRGHQRKVQSYEVETYWYQNYSHECNKQCYTPKLIGDYSEDQNQWIVLEDLNTHYPLRKYDLSLAEVKVCLKWLANFHATFLHREPNGLWPIGTYWHLDTRPDELQKIKHKELQSKARRIDQALNDCTYKTIVHGDAKLANFCFSEDGRNVAAVDFQYVGGGCGMKDVGYFLGSCLSSNDCARFEKELLSFYFSELENALSLKDIKCNFKDLEHEWRRMYPIACTDFTRFMLGWMPTHQKINKYNLKMVNEVLASF